MKLERKILMALAAHEICLNQIKHLSGLIRTCTDKCRRGYDVIGPKPEDYYPDIPCMPWPNLSEEHMAVLYDEKGFRKTHIWEAFQHKEPNSMGYMAGLHTDEIGDYLHELGCVHCTRAWYFIRKRKEERLDLGNFRRSLRALGKSAIKALDSPL